MSVFRKQANFSEELRFADHAVGGLCVSTSDDTASRGLCTVLARTPAMVIIAIRGKNPFPEHAQTRKVFGQGVSCIYRVMHWDILPTEGVYNNSIALF